MLSLCTKALSTMPTQAEFVTVAVNYRFVGQSTLKQESDGLNSKRVDSVE